MSVVVWLRDEKVSLRRQLERISREISEQKQIRDTARWRGWDTSHYDTAILELRACYDTIAAAQEG